MIIKNVVMLDLTPFFAMLDLTPFFAWKDFSLFLADNGQPPAKGMAFARLDKTEGFLPGNCEWMTKSKASKINAAHMKKFGLLVGKTGKGS